MRSKAAVFWCLLSIALGSALFAQWNAAKKQKVTLEMLQLQIEKDAAGASGASARMQELEKERMKLAGELRAAEFELNNTRLAYHAAAQATNAAFRAQPRGQSGAQNVNEAGGMGKMLENMMKNPEMRKAMEQQQRMGIDMIYGSLFKQLNLEPEVEKKLKDFLVSQQLDSMSQAGAMFAGDATERAKMAQDLAEKQKAGQAQVKEILGDEKYAEYQDYNQTLGERMMLDQFGRQAEITPDQSDELLAIMREEKRNVQINRGEAPYDATQDWQKVLGPGEAAARLFEQQEEVNNRVLERAGQVLTPEQLQKFGPVLKSQLEMQKAGMKMAQEMFGGANSNSLPQAP